MTKNFRKLIRRYLFFSIVGLICCWLLKIGGLDSFGLDTDNIVFVEMDKFFLHHPKLLELWNFFWLNLQIWLMLTITYCSKNKKLFLYFLCTIIPSAIVRYFTNTYLNGTLYLTIIEYLYLVIVLSLYNKSEMKIKRSIIVVSLITLYQFISIATRSLNFNANNYGFVISNILMIDYILLMVITSLVVRKEEKICSEDQVGLSLDSLNSCGQSLDSYWELLKHHIGSLRELSLTHKWEQLKDKKLKIEEKLLNRPFEELLSELLLNIFFIILFLGWNLLTLILIFVIGIVNGTVVECIIILISFLFNKKAFGKPLHLKNAIHCLFLSTISYYCINRITLPIGLSIICPIICGISFAFAASFVGAYLTTSLDRGMKEEELLAICKASKLTTLETEILKEFYCDCLPDVHIAALHNYSIENIWKIKKRARDKIKNKD